MKFKKAKDLEEDLLSAGYIILENQEDFNFFASKKENADYLFSSEKTLIDEEEKEVKVADFFVVYDKEIGSFFAFEKPSVPEERIRQLEELAAQREEADEAKEEEEKITSENLEKFDISKDKLIESVKEYLEKNKLTDTPSIHDKKFDSFLKKSQKGFQSPFMTKNWFWVKEAVEEIIEEDEGIRELISKNSLDEIEEKNKVFGEIAKEISQLEKYRTAKREGIKTAIIKEALYKRKIFDFRMNEIMTIKGKADIELEE